MRKTCNLVSPFINHSSIAKTGRNLVSALNSMNARFAIVDMSDDFQCLPASRERGLTRVINDAEVAELSIEKDIVFNADLESIASYSLPYKCIPYFSLKNNSLPIQYRDMLNNAERVLVYNNFTKNVISGCGVNGDKVMVVPPSVRSKIFKDANRFGVNGKKYYAFMSVVNLIEDPNWMSVVRSFYNAFSSEDDVCLVLKANDRQYSKYYQINIAREIDAEKKKYHKNLPTVILVSSSLSDKEMASLYADCDCYVRISGVNTGLGFIEAFASGLVCIGPEEGGCREILNRNTGFMIKKFGEKRISSDSPFGGTTCNLYDGEHLSEIMQWVFYNSDNLKEKTVKERKIILSQFDHNIVGQNFLKSLR